ncbi:NAD(P)/FAD-dependent oxidoreductase [Alphaproteobacteria bacterium]|nr:NAD(P)/FAD-dependent oxidoreductase [Pseudomonadota bacterium]MDB2349605.1 NAD(P)/FAD-dependent oxidoreductase [Alphaproteobacteria bacterium]
MIEKTDVVIIGAGPVGLFAIFELGLLNISCHVIDNLDKPGGQCAELYPEKPIYDIPSRVSISGQELTDDLLAQAKPFKPVYHLSQQVEKIEKLESGEWLIMTSVNKSIKAKCIVIAAGAGSFVPRKLPISDIAHLEEKNILYAVRNKSILEGKKLLIVGGGDSALDWTNELSKTSNVTLMHRRKEFKASPDSVSKMLELEKNKKVNFLLGQIKGIEDLKNDKIKVITKNNEETENFEVDYLLPFFGLKMELGPIANWGLNLDENLIKVDTEKFETSVPSIFAIGDINTYPGKLKLILSGFHEAALMAQECFKYCYPDKKNIFRYTTSSKELQKKLTSI